MRDESESSRRARRARCAAGLGLALALAAHLWEARSLQPQIDDAYISYRYARNLAEGRGLVFNPGERVEGITNLSWTLALAAAEAAGVPSPVAAHLFGVASGGVFLWLTWLWVRDRVSAERAWLAGLASLVVWSSTAFAAWVVSGLETPLFACLVLAALHAQSRGRIGWATAALIGATSTRPDGVVVAAAVYGAQLWPWRAAPSAVFAKRDRWGWPALYALAVLGLTGFRLVYYGSPLPNTFYAKVGGIPLWQGGFYVLGFLFDGAFWLLPPFVLGLRTLRTARDAPAPLHPHVGHGLLVCLIAYVLWVGGDVFAHGRFLWPAWPLLLGTACIGIDAAFAESRTRGLFWLTCLLGAGAWSLWGVHWLPVIVSLLAIAFCSQPRVRSRAPWAPVAATALGLLLVATCAQQRASERPASGEARSGGKLAALREAEDSWLASRQRTRAKLPNFLPDDVVRRQVRFVERAQPPVALVAHTAIGRFGYWSGVPILDLLGLVDAQIARAAPSRAGEVRGHPSAGAIVLPGHQRSNPDYVFRRRPDFLFINQRGAAPKAPQLPAILDLWADPRLERDYRWRPGVMAYERRDRSVGRGAGRDQRGGSRDGRIQ